MNTALIKGAVTHLIYDLCELLRFCTIENGVNVKVMKNTLSDSDLYKSIEGSVNGNIIRIMANDYITYINSGMRKGVFVPIQALTAWAAKKGIPTDNHTIYAIQRAIWRDGIPARPVEDVFLSNSDEAINDFMTNLADEITKSIQDEYYKQLSKS